MSKTKMGVAGGLIVLLVLLVAWWSYTRITRKNRPRPVELAENLGAKLPILLPLGGSSDRVREIQVSKGGGQQSRAGLG